MGTDVARLRTLKPLRENHVNISNLGVTFVAGSRELCTYIAANACDSAPWVGKLRGWTWNANGLPVKPCRDGRDKLGFVLRHLCNVDFGIVTETHADEVNEPLLQQRFEQIGYKCFWCHGTRHKGGILIVVRQNFLNNFGDNEPNFQRICAGHVCSLTFKDSGNRYFQLFGVYLDAEDRANRIRQLGAIKHYWRSGAHNFIAGDLNFCSDPNDRFNSRLGEFTGYDDRETMIFIYFCI